MTRLDDLTIFLTMVDKTRQATRSAGKNLSKLEKLTTALKTAGKLAGTTLVAAFTAAAARGSELTTGLATMGRQLNLSFQEAQALFNVVRDGGFPVDLHNLNEALLSVKERFADARVGAGPLLGLIQDLDGFNLNLNVDNARDQLANFLEQVSLLPDANAKIFALKEVVGDEDARPFFNIINNTEKLNELLVGLRTNVDDVDGVLSDLEVQNIKDAKDATNGLAREWDNFAVNLYAFISPALEFLNKSLTFIVSKADDGIDFLQRVNSRIKFLFSEIRDQLGITPEAQAKTLDEIVQAQANAQQNIRNLRGESSDDSNEANGRIRNEFGTFENLAAFEAWYSAQQKIVTQKMQEVIIESPRDIRPIDIGSSGTDFLQEIDRLAGGQSANDDFYSRFSQNTTDTSQSDADQARFEALSETINGVTMSLSAAGGAMSSFAQLAEANGSKSFKTFQRLQIAISTVAGISAQLQTLADPSLPFLSKLAAYARIATIVAGGLAQLKNVSLGSSSSTSGAGSSSGGVSTPASTAVGGLAQQAQDNTPTRNITVNIQGNGNYTPEQVEELIEAINDNDSTTQIDARRIAA